MYLTQVRYLFPTIFLLILICSQTLHAQLVINPTTPVNDLADSLLGDDVIISNVTINCDPLGYGTFTNGNTTSLGLDKGILLTNGRAVDAALPNADIRTGNVINAMGHNFDDPDLLSLDTRAKYDVCILEFDVIPRFNQIDLQYIFASEEYPEWICGSVNDVFGFFVTGPKPSGGDYTSQNIAVIPGTNTYVGINTINGAVPPNGSEWELNNCKAIDPDFKDYSIYYNANYSGTGNFAYDGYTDIMGANLMVIPCETYHVKIAISDTNDEVLDSGVFLKLKSFNSSGEKEYTMSFLDSIAIEGCKNAKLLLTRAKYTSPVTLTLNINGSADASDITFNTSQTFPINVDSLWIDISALADNTTEGIEWLEISIDYIDCFGLPARIFDTLYIQDEIYVDPLITDDLCEYCQGSITIGNGTATSPLFIKWDGFPQYQNYLTISKLCAGSYPIEVTDGYGCSVFDTIDLGNNLIPITPQISADTNTGCVPLDVVFQSLDPALLAGSTLEWDFGNGQTSNLITPSNTYQQPGCYDVSLKITATNGCIDTLILSDFICLSEEAVSSFISTHLTSNYFNFSSTSSFADTNTWIIDLGTSEEIFSSSQPGLTFQFPDLLTGEFPVCLIANNAGNCPDTSCQMIQVDGANNIYIPNSFTPNGDGKNEQFLPVLFSASVIENFEFLVFNRWGNVIFLSNSLNDAWDGTFQNEPLPNGIYPWKMKVQFLGIKEIIDRTGNVNLIK